MPRMIFVNLPVADVAASTAFYEAAAVAAGGTGDVSEAHDESVMYGRSFEDLDGHGFGPMWMDPAAMMAAVASDEPVAA